MSQSKIIRSPEARVLTADEMDAVAGANAVTATIKAIGEALTTVARKV